MDNSQSYSTYTLTQHPFGGAIMRILDTAIQSVEPGIAVRKYVKREGQTLVINGIPYQLNLFERIHLIGLGKAAYAMTLPITEMLKDYPLDGVLIPKDMPASPLAGIDVQPGGHPIPNENSLKAGEKVINLVKSSKENDLLICLISGGGSALMSAPLDGVMLKGIQEVTSALLGCGAPIHDINIVRRHLDVLKGGGLARLTSPARVVSLILSDVVGSPLETIASGPTAPDPSTRAEAISILHKYDLLERVPPEILKALKTSAENPKPGDEIFTRVQNVIVGSNVLATKAAQSKARAEGFNVTMLGNDWQGEAREVSHKLCDLIRNYDGKKPVCMIAGGETTVTLRGQGKGGRNQELALAAVRELASIRNALLVSMATDGEDGPTDAAGAVVSSDSLERGVALGLSPDDYLKNNDAYTYFNELNDQLKPGPSGTNVNDLTFIFLF